MKKLKILLFTQDGKMEPKHMQYKFDQEKLGNRVVLCNGSIMAGFEDSCDAVTMDCKNKKIEDWAKKNKISFRHTLYTKEEPKVDPVDDGIDVGKEIEKILEAAPTEVKESQYNRPSQMKAGVYESPLGEFFIKKKGPNPSREMAEAIGKYGVHALIFRGTEAEFEIPK
jgi:hypothetical protein